MSERVVKGWDEHAARAERVRAALKSARTLKELSLSLRLAGVWASVKKGAAEVQVQDKGRAVRWVFWFDGGRWRGVDRLVSQPGEAVDDVVSAMGAMARWCPVQVGGGL